MYLRPYKTTDYDAILPVLRGRELADVEMFGGESYRRSIVEYAAASGESPVVTICTGADAVAAICGATEVGIPGVWEIWLLLSRLIEDNRIGTARAFKQAVKIFEEIYQPRRIQVSVEVGFEQGAALVESHGFQKEGIMRKYYPDGKDHWLFAKVF